MVMQHEADPLMTIAAAARKIGVNRSTLSRQVKLGQVRSHKGKVRLSEVLADRASNIDLIRSGRRSGHQDGDDEAPDGATGGASGETTPGHEDPIIVDGEVLSFKVARALKETYLARLRKLEFERESGALVSVEEVGRHVEREYGIVRERLLTVPGKLAAMLVGLPRHEIEAALRTEVTEALTQLSSPTSAG